MSSNSKERRKKIKDLEKIEQSDLGATLANDNGARLGDLVAVYLDSEPLADGIATVLCASSSLLVRIFDGEWQYFRAIEAQLGRHC